VIRSKIEGVTALLRRLRKRKRKPRARRTRARTAKGIVRLVFFAPALFLILLFVAYPVFATIGVSFLSSDGKFAGLTNYEDVLGSPDTVNLDRFPKPPPLGTLIHNAIWIGIHLPLSLFLGLWLALVLRDLKGAAWIKTAIFVGMVTPLIIGGILMLYIYDGQIGIVPNFFGIIGVESLAVGWMQRPATLLFGLIFGSVWLWTGFSLIVYSAGLTTIPKDFWEAAQVDGTSTLRMFTRVTFPLLKPMTVVVITMTILWELKIFDLVYGSTNPQGGVGGAADVLALQMFRYAFVQLPANLGAAAAVATFLSILTMAATVMTIRYMVKR
jgi:multiple sugar transport system permease protein